MKLNEEYEFNHLGLVFHDTIRHKVYSVLDIQQTWAIIALIKKYNEVGSPQKLLEQLQKDGFNEPY